MNSPSQPLLRCALRPSMGEEVLQWLAQRQQLPEFGIVAGQSVLTALLELYGDGKRRGPLNDIDIFQEVTPERAKVLEDERKNGVEAATLMGHASVRGSASNPCRQIRIASASDDGLLNVIEIIPDFDPLRPQSAANADTGKGSEWRLFPGGITATDLIGTFDFNAISCAIDLKERTLTWLPSFAAFLESGGQLEITDKSTPHTTLARMLKKRDEMPWLQGDKNHLDQQCMFGMTVSWIQRNELTFPSSHLEIMQKLDPCHAYTDPHEDWKTEYLRNHGGKAQEIPMCDRIAQAKGWGPEQFTGELREKAQEVRTPEFWSDLVLRGVEFGGAPHPSDALAATSGAFPWRVEGLYAVQYPLHAAVAYDDRERLSSLLAAGSLADERDNYGRTPAHWAASMGRFGHLEALIGAGADLTLRNRSGVTPLQVAEWTPEYAVVTRAFAARAACHDLLKEWALESAELVGAPR